MRILTVKQSRELDRIAMQKNYIPVEELMKNAGRHLAGIVKEQSANELEAKIAVVCGKGNNGGDGFAAAGFLVDWNCNVDVFCTVQKKDIKGAPKHFYSLLEEKGQEIRFIKAPPRKHGKYIVVVDAVLGTGFKGRVRPDSVPWLNWMNRMDSQIISADIASGLDADNGLADKSAVRADKTVTMGYPKLGMELNDGPACGGEIVPVDIGFPEIPDNMPGFNWSLFDESSVQDNLPALEKSTYKHQQGKVLVLAGSTGMTGAAVLSSMAALCSGAGLVKAFAPASLNSIYEIKMTEVMTIPCEDNGKGYFGMENLETIKANLDWCDVLVIGPGLGSESETQNLVKNLVTTVKKPMVLDADGLRPFYRKTGLIAKISAPFVMTPHYGELARILNKSIPELKAGLPTFLTGLCGKIKGVLVAKNAPTICIDGKLGVINTSGNPGLATAGTGDVLTGIIASLIAQGLDTFFAAQMGVFLHGRAAELFARDTGQRGLVASDLLYSVSKTISQYE